MRALIVSLDSIARLGEAAGDNARVGLGTAAALAE